MGKKCILIIQTRQRHNDRMPPQRAFKVNRAMENDNENRTDAVSTKTSEAVTEHRTGEVDYKRTEAIRIKHKTERETQSVIGI